MRLRAVEGRKYLVSDQSSCRGDLRGIAETRTRTAVFVSCRQLCDCGGATRTRVHARGVALWRGASHVPAAADGTRRTDRTGVVVGATVLVSKPSESITGKPHRLVLVHGFTDCLRPRRRPSCRTAITYADA